MCCNQIQYTGKILSTSTGGTAALADSSLIPGVDPDQREGWLFQKAGAGTEKFNIYYWTQGSKVLKGSDIRTLNAIVSVDNYQSGSSVPFFVIYTKPKGDGSDAQPWYNARRAFSLTPTERIEVGQQIELYAKHIPPEKGVHQVLCNTITDEGTWNDEDEILYITLHSDSAAPTSSKFLIQALGLEIGRNNKILLELVSQEIAI